MEHNSFTVLCWFLLYNVNWLYFIHITLPLWASCSIPPLLGYQRTKLSSLCHTTGSHYFTHNSVYMSALPSQFIPPSSSCSCPQVPSLHLHFLLLSASYFSSCGSRCLSLQKIWLFKAPKFPILRFSLVEKYSCPQSKILRKKLALVDSWFNVRARVML